MTLKRWTQIALGYLTFISLQIGIWALVAPRSFYDDFPGIGGGWVNVDGPYNEHLIRDVGALNLALAALFIFTIVKVSRDLLLISGTAALVWGVAHFGYHVANADLLDGVDAAASLGGLALFVLLGGGVVWVAKHDSAETP